MVAWIGIRSIIVNACDEENKPVCIIPKSLKLHFSIHFILFDLIIFEKKVIIQISCFCRFTKVSHYFMIIKL